MISCRSSGSRAVDNGVEPTRSQNRMVSCRRSPSSSELTRGDICDGSAASCLPSKDAMASSSRRRCPIEATPSCARSSPVSRGNTFASMLLSRNAGAYCPSPSPRSHSAMSIGIARNWLSEVNYISATAFCPGCSSSAPHGLQHMLGFPPLIG